MTEERRSEDGARAWEGVRDMMQGPPVEFGSTVAYWFAKTPRRALYATAYYKFAAKMLGKGRRVVDVGCSEGLGTWLLAVECGEALGVDFDADAIACAKRNWQDERIAFDCADVFELPPTQQGRYGGAVCFDVIEHIFPERAPAFVDALAELLDPNGTLIVGTPNVASQQHASEVTNAGHVNLYDAKRLEAELRRRFEFVFMFAANDELIHTGFFPMAHYLLAVACGRR